MAKTTDEQLKELQAQIKDLQGALESESVKRTAAEEHASAMSKASQFVSGATSEEFPTGNTVPVEVCLNPWEKNEKKQKFHTVDMPTFKYTIILPAGAGNNLSTNGVEYFHGQTYEFDPIILAEMKSRVARCWDHEKSIHGDNENSYRKPLMQKV